MTCYAISEYDKSHYKFSNGGDAVEFLRTAEVPGVRYRLAHADADGWIKHDGGECPLPHNAACSVKCGFSETRNVMAGGVDWQWTDRYRPILEDKEQDMSEQEWSGEGLPPVGSEVEAKMAYDTWMPVRVLHHHKSSDEAVVVAIDDSLSGWADEFRPIRTPAQRAEDEAVEAINDVWCRAAQDAEDGMRAVYAAIRDGRIPGVKLEGE